ncbi:hypothetical protein HDV02_004792 [Globomyces sp. JEL0801]|nr:hypothetical protein HDV02_004792 [Globomyces sp. JEL0801]
MLACFFITYRTLKSQQSNRRTLLSGDTFYTHENFKHHASVMMMRYIGVLFVIDFLIWMPSICYSICLIVYNFPPQSNLPLIMELSYNIFEVTFAANGLFHAIGIHLAQRKIILVPPKPDSENPPQIIQISPTSEIQPIFQRSHYSNSIRGTIDLIREGEGQVLTTASLAIPSYQSSFLESTEGVEDPGIVTAYVHNYVVHPVIFIKAMLVAYWTSMFTWMSNRP